MAAGIAFVPEDRRQQGLVMDLAIDHNVALASLGAAERGGLIFRGGRARAGRDWAERLRLKYGRLRDPVNHPVGRQPAEGRACQMAGPASRRC